MQDVPGLVEKLKGHPLQAMALIALFAGLRLGEVMALRWSRIDLDKKTLQVREALEQTKQHGTRLSSRNPRPESETSPCPTSWSQSCVSIERPNSNCA